MIAIKRVVSVLFLLGAGRMAVGCSSGGGGKTDAAGSGSAGNTTAGAAGSTMTAGAAGSTTTAAAGTTGAAGSAMMAGAAGSALMGAAGAPSTGAAGSGTITGAAGTTGAAGSATAGMGAAGNGGDAAMTFFVTSDTSMTGNLGGLAGADKRCQDLATAAGQGSHTWHAYLSVSTGLGGAPVNARDRLGNGPWHNAKGALVASNLTELHDVNKHGDYMLFIDEKGQPIPGQWAGSPAAAGVQHDILTGSNADGTLKANETCKDWTSMAAADKAWVGHSDGLGPGGSMDASYRSWNSTHENGGCDNTVPKGGKGRLYCFATN